MAQKHNAEYTEKPMTRDGRIQGPSRRYRRLRHPTFPAAEWTAKNPLLQRGEIGVESDTHKIKVGDGLTYWNDLAYSVGAGVTEWGDIQGDIDDQIDLANALSAKQDTLTAGTNINITGTTISATDTTYTGSDGITLTGTNFTNSGVRSVASGTANGTISVNTNGTSADVAVTGLGSAAYTNSTDYATTAQGAKADTAVQPADLSSYVTKDTTQTITGEKTFSGLMNYSAGKTYILAGNGGTKLGYWSYDIDGGSNITLQTMTASTRNINFKTNNGGKVTYNGSEIAKVSDLPSVMTGATAGDAGTSGLVPAPAAGDQGKFLQGDGTWATLTIPTVNDSTITLTQNGVTKGSFTLNQASNDTIALDVGDTLPDQTGQSGKFLTTDGTDASWSDKPLVNGGTGTNSLSIGNTNTYNTNTLIGINSDGASYGNALVGSNTSGYRQGVAIGSGAVAGNSSSQKKGGVSIGYASTNSGNYGICIGYTAKTQADNAIQIGSIGAGSATNSDANTLKVANANGNFEIMSADGTIPEARLADTTSATAGQVLALDSNLDGVWTTLSIPAAQVNSDWNANSGVAEILNKPTTLSGYGITDGVDTNLSNITNTGKEVCGHMAMPSGTRANLTFGASGTSYTAPGDGYFVIEMTATSSSSYCTVVKGTYHIADYGGNLGIYNMIIPASKGQQITISYGNCSIFWFYFEYTNGAA